ncbi:unnamed protein product [Dovyalis caffra]|uniref:Uncharacterized protein n=1 Tax=Dovyalis caffra TaxID=77055 RepID=A0AAV1SIC6_9ROSI|nr:unnamed protein product [Dovyalis caffra]
MGERERSTGACSVLYVGDILRRSRCASIKSYHKAPGARGVGEKDREGMKVVGLWAMEARCVASRLLVKRRRLGREGSSAGYGRIEA